jgi:hypothetical protein
MVIATYCACATAVIRDTLPEKEAAMRILRQFARQNGPEILHQGDQRFLIYPATA